MNHDIAEADHRAPPRLPPKAVLGKYIGALVRDGTLFASNSHHGEFALSATTKDKFRSGKFFFQEVTFLRNPQDRVTALTVGGGRVTAIRFERKQTP